MINSPAPSRCVLCGFKLVKNGRNTAGNQRWRCPRCGVSSVRKRPDRSQLFTLLAFLDWLMGKHTQAQTASGGTGRSFRHRTAWCWQLHPQIEPTGEIYAVIQIDGFNLRTGWCVLTARSGSAVVAYQWCARESQAAWGALLAQLPEPAVVVCDGGPGMRAALKEHWPNTRIQRCLVHLQRNIRKYVTTRSKTAAGQALWGLGLQLPRIKTAQEATNWLLLLQQWESEYLDLTKERTYRKDSAEVPAWARPAQKWWYTHQRLRSGHQVLRRVIKSGHLFTFLDPAFGNLQVPSNTNGIEGATNAQMRLLLLHHRGMSEQHQRCAIQWWLYLHSQNPDPARVLTQHQKQPPKANQTHQQEHEPGPAGYDTGLSTEEGLWIRKGWAGRA